jgi:hypothetical protein
MDIRMGLLMADLELAAETAQDDAMGVWRNGADEIRERRQAEADALELTPPVEVEEPTFIDRLPINLSWFVVSGIIGLTWVQIGRGITKQGWPLWFSIGIGCAISAFCLLCLCVIGVGKEADRGRW